MKNKIIAIIIVLCIGGIMVFAESLKIVFALLCVLWACGLMGGFDKDFLKNVDNGKKNNTDF